MLALIWVQTVCKSDQQTTLVGNESTGEGYLGLGVIIPLIPAHSDYVDLQMRDTHTIKCLKNVEIDSEKVGHINILGTIKTFSHAYYIYKLHC